ncbi:N-formylglutamate amidohydrolase [Rubellicoccus peritrichatus]|uniref:N-formylglutamate amidohydrolase n=1 Tax=Rubellicoccus peritrichatus TaxID=3080537 RepID=A0AAQ3QVS6_9BACT|nr:N-formylglutamate amidohydrolase [Puniceicoccus sp. CR14]WOO41205.1 N-formylglutamate amidohydrolase [Puniceicoccus sp. CR14]
MTSLETSPVAIINAEAVSDFVLICEHAGNLIPGHLDNLGLDKDELTRHIAWDIGAEGVARSMAELLQAPLIMQRYSRLVYDCNRPPSADDAMPARSELTDIPGNQNIITIDRDWRIRKIYQPFENTITSRIDTLLKAGRKPTIVTVHTFTPVYKGKQRTLDLGLLFNQDDQLAQAMLRQSSLLPDYDIRLNQPYGPKDGVMHTVMQHAEPHGLPYVMIEIRNDHVSTKEKQQRWAHMLNEMIQQATQTLKITSNR